MQRLIRKGWAMAGLATMACGAQATIVSCSDAKAGFVKKPVNMKYKANSYGDQNLRLWDEQTNFLLPKALVVDTKDAGDYRAFSDLGNYRIPVGTLIDSAYIVFDPYNSRTKDVTVTFSGKILGVIVYSDRKGNDRLQKSDYLALPDVPTNNFPVNGHLEFRGLELPGTRKGKAIDWISIDGKVLTIHLQASSPGDQIRVITQGSG